MLFVIDMGCPTACHFWHSACSGFFTTVLRDAGLEPVDGFLGKLFFLKK
jgi:hypothetical protein